MKRAFKISVDCANCANKMEDCANKIDGVKSAVVNFMASKIIIEFEDGADTKTVMSDVLNECKKIERDVEIIF